MNDSLAEKALLKGHLAAFEGFLMATADLARPWALATVFSFHCRFGAVSPPKANILNDWRLWFIVKGFRQFPLNPAYSRLTADLCVPLQSICS